MPSSDAKNHRDRASDHAKDRDWRFAALPLERLREMERLFGSKNECSPAVNKAGRELLRAYQEAEVEIVRLRVGAGIPSDLAPLLLDPTIITPRDQEIRLADGRTLAEHLLEWRNAPSNTASADLSGDDRA